MSFKIKQAHLLTIMEYMQENKDLATGKLSVANGKEEFRKLWANLATKLNALGYGVRTVEKWQKSWSDYKGNLKKKAAEIRRYEAGTGGGPPFDKKLSEVEIGILNLLGNTFFEGCGVPEKGLEYTLPCSRPQDYDIATPSCSGLKSTGPMSCSTRDVENTPSSKQSTNQVQDHDYLPTNTIKRRKGYKRKISEDSKFVNLYEESIKSLKSIENTVGAGLDKISDTLNNRLMDLTDAVKSSLGCKCSKNA